MEKPQILTDRRSVGLVCKPGRPEADQAANRIAEFMGSQDIRVVVDPGSCGVSSERADPTPIEEMDVDFVVTVGGDGTILYTLSRMKDREIPLFCINRGSVGFLTETSTTTAITALEKVIENECVIEHNVNIASGVGERQFEEALNEVYVVSKMPGRLLTFQVHIDGVRIDYGRADGAMVSTPCGSTAYALAAGGSILSPDVNGFIFVPVCPPRFELKSVVVPDSCVIELELVKPGTPGLAVIDGQTTWDIGPSEKVWIKKADCVSKFIRLYDNYWDRVNTRLVPRTL
ncbi:MAG: NAD(+)/NADH kinase [Candidatus Hermodarchaeota archaeon]